MQLLTVLASRGLCINILSGAVEGTATCRVRATCMLAVLQRSKMRSMMQGIMAKAARPGGSEHVQVALGHRDPGSRELRRRSSMRSQR
jgi:hypothetical protein